MSQLAPTSRAIVRAENGALRVLDEARDKVKLAVLRFLDSIATATGRETFYNTREEQLAAEAAIHQAVFDLDRGLYSVLLALPGGNDHSTQVGVRRLLDEPRAKEELLSHDQEARLLRLLIERLPPQRLIKLFVMLQQGRINNRRTRRLILESILGSGKLPLWSVKYRLKLRAALRHALGTGQANGVRDLTSQDQRDRAGAVKLERLLGRYLPADADRGTVYECVNFILGGKRKYAIPLLAAFHGAQTDLEQGQALPVEVLEGIRSRFHKDVPHARVLELANKAGTITEGQKLALQRSAAKHDVELIFDARKADMVRLYVYALECGMTAEVRQALDEKARRHAHGLAVRYDRIGIVVDASASMLGTVRGKYRPLAVSLALRDILAASAREAHVRASHGSFDENGLIRPEGETSLAVALVGLAAQHLEAIYLLTDGYENAPAGRVDEVVRQLRIMGITTAIYQMTPVLAGEVTGVRSLSSLVSALPISRPEGLGLALVRAALEQDIDRGIQGLLSLAAPLLENKAQ
jgi:hypothetical protein